MNQSPNIAASVRTRLTNQSTSAREDFQVILTRYALERFLYRISVAACKQKRSGLQTRHFWAHIICK
jgi:hypothetical protein